MHLSNITYLDQEQHKYAGGCLRSLRLETSLGAATRRRVLVAAARGFSGMRSSQGSRCSQGAAHGRGRSEEGDGVVSEPVLAGPTWADP